MQEFLKRRSSSEKRIRNVEPLSDIVFFEIQAPIPKCNKEVWGLLLLIYPWTKSVFMVPQMILSKRNNK